ncbi:MAG: hypothetical protein AAFX65_05610 [Cyanobacteria bacterium J06638_7]
MTPRPAPLRRLLLCGLAGWACLLSLETLLRRPGFAPAGALPPLLQLDGAPQPRRPAAPPGQQRPAAQLPDGVVELGAARYGERQLRLLAHRRSGASGRMPLQAINAALGGSPQGGRCLVVDGQGRVLAELASDADWLAWRRAHPPSGAATLRWLAGLRPRHANLCLWTATPLP